MFFFFDEENTPFIESTAEKPGVQRIKSFSDFKLARDNERRLNEIYEEMGLEKEEEDKESEVVAEAGREQVRILEEFKKQYELKELKYLSSNIEYLLKRENLRAVDLEYLLGVSSGYISRTLGPKAKKRLSIDVITQISDVFKINIDDLVYRDLTAPNKDVEKVEGFLNKLKKQTDEEIIHWSSIGKTANEDNALLLKDKDGETVYTANEKKALTLRDEIYHAYTSVGDMYICAVSDVLFESEDFEIYLQNPDFEDDIRNGIETVELIPMCITADDNTGTLQAICNGLFNSVKTHKVDYVIDSQANRYMDKFMNEETELSYADIF